MIVTAHQPTYLPGTSVLAKIARADAVIWLDAVRFTTPGYVNRNRLPDGTWLTIPVERRDHRTLIRDVVIGEDEAPGWQATHAATLLQRYGRGAVDPRLLDAIRVARRGDRLLDVNLTTTARLLELAGIPATQHLQSRFVIGGTSLSAKTARMVRELGGTEYLSGPNGRRLLDARAFEREGVTLSFFNYSGPNPSAVDPLFREGALPSPSPDTHREAVVPA